MLAPDQRQLYVNALKPPTGYVLGEAVATTYSLDLTKLLSVPFALVMPHVDPQRLGDEGAIELLQALRSAAGKLTVFCERAGISAPQANHVMYALLERVVVEVTAPAGGSLHAKLWLVRFDPEDGHAPEPLMRLVVLSRNLTHDRCWDVSVLLEGRVTGRNRSKNKPLYELLTLISQRAVYPLEASAQARVDRLAEQAWRTEWDLPPGFESYEFHALGMSKRTQAWLPVPSRRLAVMSPFVGAQALQELAATSQEPVALISRPEELDQVAADELATFTTIWTLHEAAASEDGEDLSEEASRTKPRGLHAKVYIAEEGWNTHLYLGSANATDGALLGGMNLEFMVELVGKTSAVPGKGIDGLLGSEGFGAMLSKYESPSEPVVVDAAAAQAERALADAARALAVAGLGLSFEPAGAEYVPILSAATPFQLEQLAEMRAWLISTDASNARDARALTQRGSVQLALCAPESVTGFVAFELVSIHPGVRITFTLNVPIANVPFDRDGHITRLVVNNRERLLRYLISLLDAEGMLPGNGADAASGSGWRTTDLLAAGLLERLLRARSRFPQRLEELRQVLDALLATPEGKELVPADLLAVWDVVKAPEAQP